MATTRQHKMAAAFEYHTDAFKSAMTIEKALSLIQDKHTSSMIQRHCKAMYRLSTIYKKGYFLKDLENLCKLLLLVAERLEKCPDYEEPLKQLIAIFGMPFLMEHSSDENTYTTNVLEILLLLGNISISCTERICIEIGRILSRFYMGGVNEEINIPKELQGTNKSYHMILIERSGVASCLIKSLNSAQEKETQITLLETLLLLSHSSINCNHMLTVGGAGSICEKYLSMSHDTSHDTDIISIALEVIWNLLENGSKLQVSQQLSSYKCIKIFQSLFKHLMLNSVSKKLKQLRNDVVMIVSLIASNCSDPPFVETQFLKDICEFTTYFSEDEYNLTSSHYKFKLSYDEEDFELQKSLMCLLITLSSLTASVRVLSSTKVVRFFLSFVATNDLVNTKWNSAQFEELQLLGLSCLSVLAPHCIEDYMTCQGNTRLLLLVEWCIKDDQKSDFHGHGNSFHGTGGRSNKLSQLHYSLRLLLAMSGTKDSKILQDLHEQGIIPLLISLLKFFSKNPDSYTNSVLVEIQSDSLLILSCLCDTDLHRKELFGGYDGVPVLVDYLRCDPSEFSDGSCSYRLVRAAIDAVWSTVIGHSSVEDIFLEESGIFVLLDLLNTSPKNLKSSILGVLVDISENPKAITHLTTWNANRVWSLLAELWRQEEKDLEVHRDVMGSLAGTTLPLLSAHRNAPGIPPLPTLSVSPSIEDVIENSRAKIYALCSKIGFSSSNNGESAEDKITLCIVENYLDFKTGEVWYEVASELSQEGLRPTSPDQECLEEIIQCSEEKAEEVTRQQHDIMDEQHRQDLDDEYQFYEQLREGQFSIEREEEKQKSYLQRTSNYQHLKNAKQKQLDSLDASRPSLVTLGARFHCTNQSSLNITAFCGRQVTIETTPMRLLANSQVPAPQQQTTST